MMKRALRFSIFLAGALAAVPFLPFYIKRTMMRSWRVDDVGDVIEWGWEFCTLRSYWADFNYITQEQDPSLWLGVNLALAFTYAVVVAFIADRVLARRKHRG